MPKRKWTFLSNHGRLFIYLAGHPNITVQALAFKAGLSLRAVNDILDDLEKAGYLTREKIGRGNRYEVYVDKPMRHRMDRMVSVASMVEAFGIPNNNHGGFQDIEANKKQYIKGENYQVGSYQPRETAASRLGRETQRRSRASSPKFKNQLKEGSL